jgi:hypothetical protein
MGFLIFGVKTFFDTKVWSYKPARRGPIPDLRPGSHHCNTESATEQRTFRHLFGEQDISHLMKGMIMTTNKNAQPGKQGGTPEQHAEAGRQSHKNDASKQSGAAGSSSRSSGGGTRGGTPEQHAEAGRQSHKNDGNKQSGSAGSSSRSSGTRGGTPEQHAEAGRQSHKNSGNR